MITAVKPKAVQQTSPGYLTEDTEYNAQRPWCPYCPLPLPDVIKDAVAHIHRHKGQGHRVQDTRSGKKRQAFPQSYKIKENLKYLKSPVKEQVTTQKKDVRQTQRSIKDSFVAQKAPRKHSLRGQEEEATLPGRKTPDPLKRRLVLEYSTKPKPSKPLQDPTPYVIADVSEEEEYQYDDEEVDYGAYEVPQATPEDLAKFIKSHDRHKLSYRDQVDEVCNLIESVEKRLNKRMDELSELISSGEKGGTYKKLRKESGAPIKKLHRGPSPEERRKQSLRDKKAHKEAKLKQAEDIKAAQEKAEKAKKEAEEEANILAKSYAQVLREAYEADSEESQNDEAVEEVQQEVDSSDEKQSKPVQSSHAPLLPIASSEKEKPSAPVESTMIQQEKNAAELIIEKAMSLIVLHDVAFRVVKEHYGFKQIDTNCNTAVVSGEECIPGLYSSYDFAKVTLDRSPLHGIGVFADEVIRKGSTVLEYRGRFKKVSHQELNQNYTYQVRDYLILDATTYGNEARFINSSYQDPARTNLNSEVVHLFGDGLKVLFYATKRIEKHDELLLEYPFGEEELH